MNKMTTFYSVCMELLKKNIVVGMNLFCCNTCASEDIYKYFDDYIGYCYFHQQDTMNYFYGTDKYLYLGFGDTNKDGKIDEYIGNIIFEAFKEAGFEIIWDGTSNMRIKINVPVDKMPTWLIKTCTHPTKKGKEWVGNTKWINVEKEPTLKEVHDNNLEVLEYSD